MSFVITIDVKESEARAKTKALGDELKGTEAAAKRTGAAIGQGAREGAAEVARTTKAVQTLGQAFQGIGAAILREQLGGVANAFAGVTAQLKLEADMLERIHGPMQQLQDDVRALQALQAKGLITADQYAAALEKSQRAAGANVGGSLRDRFAEPAPAMGMMPAGESGVSGLITKGATLAVAHEVAQLGDEYLNLKNRLRAVATDEANLNSLMALTKGVAQDTRSDWESVANVYTRLQIAMRDTGASQSQVLAMTKTLSQGLQVAGATAFEAQMTMMELSHALQTGVLSGREFRVMMKDAAPLMAELQKVSGKTAAEFAEMGKHGKLTAELLMDLFAKAGPAIEEKFGKTVPTLTQQWVMFKNELVDSVGHFVEASHIIPIVGNVLGGIVSILKPLMAGLSAVAGGLAYVGDKAKDLGHVVGVDLKLGLGTLVGYIAGGPVGAALGTLAEGMVNSASVMSDVVNNLDAYAKLMGAFYRGVDDGLHSVHDLKINIDGLDDSLKRIAGTLPDVTNKFLEMLIGFDAWDPNKTKKRIDDYGQVLKDIREPTQRYGEMIKANNEYLRNTGDVQGYTIELNKLNKALLSAYELQGKAGRKGPNAENVFKDVAGRNTKDLVDAMRAQQLAEEEFQRRSLGDELRAPKIQIPSDLADQFAKLARDSALEHVAAATKKWNSELEKTRDDAKKIVEALQPVEDMLVNMARTGELSWKRMIDEMIAEAERFAAHKLITSGVTALFGGGGGTSLAQASGVPGGATGGSWIVGGSGGTDSSIAMLRASPGERLTVETQQQQAANDAARGGGSSGPMKVQIVYGRDRRGLLRGDDSLTRVVLDDMAKNPRRYRSVLGRA